MGVRCEKRRTATRQVGATVKRRPREQPATRTRDREVSRRRRHTPRSSRPARRKTTSSVTCSPSTASSTARTCILQTGCSGRCGGKLLKASITEAIGQQNRGRGGAVQRSRTGVPRRSREGPVEREAAAAQVSSKRATATRRSTSRPARRRQLGAPQLSGEMQRPNCSPPWECPTVGFATAKSGRVLILARCAFC